MKSFNYVITDDVGIHARPAGALVKLIKTFDSTVTMGVGDKVKKASSPLAIMGLGAVKGTEVTITVDGPDEDAACEAIEAFLKENL